MTLTITTGLIASDRTAITIVIRPAETTSGSEPAVSPAGREAAGR